MRLLLAALAVALLAGGCASYDAASAQGQPKACAGRRQIVQRDIPYRDVPKDTDPKLVSLDTYRPAPGNGCGAAPVLIYVHGGGWVGGDKADVKHKAELAQKQGWVLVSVNYRLGKEGRYPGFDDDVADAVAWTHRNARTLGGDPDRLILSGHSAGATITAGVATDQRHLQNAGDDLGALRCAIPLDSAYDITKEAHSGVFRAAFGEDALEDGSATAHVTRNKGIPPFLIVTRGADTRRSRAHDFQQLLTKADVPAKIIDLGPDVTHDEVDDAVGNPGDGAVTPQVVAFVASCKP